MRAFIIFLVVISLFLFSGCERINSLYTVPEKESGLTYVPPESINIEVEQATGKALLDKTNQTVMITVEGLNLPDSEHTYEAWLISTRADGLVSLGTFSVDENGDSEFTKQVSADIISNTNQVVVSLEPVDDGDATISDTIVLEGSIIGTADVVEIMLEPTESAKKTTVEKIAEQEQTEKVVEPVSEPEVVEEEPEEIIAEPVEGIEGAIIIEETEKVNLKPKAYDPDQDSLKFSYTTPLDSEGFWQTGYGDAGEYTVVVTASDGELSTSKSVLIIVNKKEEAPTIDSFEPTSLSLSSPENTDVTFSVVASDLNMDKLTYSWKIDGQEVSKDNSFMFEISYEDAGEHNVSVTVSDGVKEVSKEWALTVENVNREPVLEPMSDITVTETDTVTIVPKAIDPDGDDLSFTISEPVGDDGEWETTYNDSGEYTVTVSVTDGTDTVSQSITLTVENLNRPPVIEDIVNE